MFTLRATLDDDRELLAEVDGRDIRRWEASAKASFLAETTYTQLHDLAWMALDRTRGIDMRKGEWDLRCVKVVEEGEPVDPTRPEATDGP